MAPADSYPRHQTHGEQPSSTPARAASRPDTARALQYALHTVLADVFGLYIKTKRFQWQLRGRHFRDHQGMLEEQSLQLFAMTQPLADCARKLGSNALTPPGLIAGALRVMECEIVYPDPIDMLLQLRQDNHQLTKRLCLAHTLCSTHGLGASALACRDWLENWLEQTQQRDWFLLEATRPH